MKIRLILVIVYCFQSILVCAQPNPAKYLSLQEGLSSQQVIDVVHDQYGFIWIATEMGLNRFASNSFKQFYKTEKADGSSVNSNEINTLFCDDDKLYIGTRANGLNVYDMKTNRFSYYLHHDNDPKSIATNDITDIIKSGSGKFWLATYHQGVQRFDPVSKTFERFNKKTMAGLAENSIWSLVEDHSGMLYAGHVNKGISILDIRKRSTTVINTANSAGLLPDNEVKSLFCDQNNNIWIGTRKGLAVYNPYTKLLQKISLAKKSRNGLEPFIYTIKEINGSIWIGAESSQLFILKTSYAKSEKLLRVTEIGIQNLHRGNTSSVQSIDRDQFGNIWMGIYSGGIAFSTHQKPFFSILSTENLIQSEGRPATVTSILNDRDNSMWLGTVGDGVIQIAPNGKAIKSNMRNSGIADDFLLSGYLDKDGNRWFGLQDGGVSFFESKTRKWKKIDAGEKMTSVRAIVEDRHGNICFAAEEGVFIHHLKTNTFKKLVTNKPMMGDFAPRTLIEDNKGNMWIGTYGQGIYIFDSEGKLINKISKGEGIKSNTINHLFSDHDNNIWIATNDGLGFHPAGTPFKQIKSITPPGGGAWLTINAITEDRDQNIWCSTRLGLLRYLPKQKRFFSYDQSFGLPLGGFTINSVGKDQNGRIFFGMPTGVCYFDPKDIPLSLPKSPIRISRFIVFNTGETHAQSEKHLDPTEKINLKHNENSFRVELAVMDYALHDLVEFSYQLHGLDEKWVYIGAEKNLDFRNIPHGDYELRIRTRQKNEQWSEDYQKVRIQISPPLYLSNYALVLYAIVILAIIITLVTFHIRKVYAEAELRLKKLQIEHDGKLNLERMNFYTNITHELRTPLTLILGPLEDLLSEEKLSHKHKDWVLMVQKNANRLFSLVNQLLEFRKVESQHKPLVLGENFLGELVQQIVNKYTEANNNPDLRIICNIEQDDIKTNFDAEIVQLILDNLLSNACKYTVSGKIEVRLRYEQDRLSTTALICVADTGCGIEKEHLEKIFDRYYQIPKTVSQGTGVGLALVKELTAIHQGKISVKSEPGKGSEFCVRLLTNAVASNSPVTQPEATHQTIDETARPLVLLVEDERDVREYLAKILAVNYEVITAQNGREGFAEATKRIPDLILSDVMMPDMDGFEMLTRIKEQRETSHIPSIFLTAKDTDSDKAHGYRLGIDSYLTKPVSPKVLNLRIENLLMKRKAVYASIMEQLSSDRKTGKENEAPATNPDLWRENAFVSEFVNLVEACIQDEVLDAATLSEKMNMSQSTLYRKLKGLTGKNINQLVRKIRIQRAAHLLRSGEYNVTEVALMVGINSSIYFRQCFKEEFGLLPSEYQKKGTQKA
ncbi:hybrid sensor histidine kinase/response regulator transcription factor [Pedobacter rhizosphaerae]|uniref:histidine kinase n=1 Tax=Pedobacter rhizosphaerae TaxID=390241 RepID=A0A1H9QNP3_9SPHI|nr:two-component regulator propeller domain-containing protein [Pedobacter rhizosphaerae]SER62058.1 Signal transduction histidine kinase [Pedobacter rhizosphaerae]